MTRRRAVLFALLSMAIAAGGMLLMAEIVLRFLPVSSGMRMVPVTAADPVFHFTPNRDYVFSREWDFVMVNHGRVNNAGYVNDQDYRKGETSPLVAVVGDSYVEALMVPYPETMHGRLAKTLDGRARVYSFAASGAPLSQYLVWAEHAVREYGAQYLVINVVGNDFDESHIDYRLGQGFWIYVPEADGTLRLRLIEFRPGVLWRIASQSALARYLILNMRLSQYMFGIDALRSFLFGRPALADPRYAGNTAVDVEPRRVEASLKALDAFFRDLPLKTGLPADRIVFVLDGFRYPETAAKAQGTFFALMRRQLTERATARGYEVIDLEPRFNADFRAHGVLFDHPRDGHWNGRGHGIAADAVLKSKMIERLRSGS